MGNATTIPTSLPPARRTAAGFCALLTTFALPSCAPMGPAGTPSPTDEASESEWRSLATARPSPLEGAVRVSVGEVGVLGDAGWSGAVAPGIALSELVSTGLLRRRDVHFVERRRFAEAAERERRGLPRPRGAPPTGTSPGAELILTATWASVGTEAAYLDLRLADAETGGVTHTWRTTTTEDADPASLARTIVGGLLELLAEDGRLPAWSDPRPETATATFTASGTVPSARASFLDGLAAEERWDWEGARRGYQAALATDPGFVEAAAALARAARLRNGGTLGAS